MNRNTGRAVTGLEHLRQSVADILTTPVGSRVMRRDYGSLVPELIDQPDNEATQVRLFSAVAGALMRWEPRLRLSRVATARDAAQQRSRAHRQQIAFISRQLAPISPGAAQAARPGARGGLR